MEAEFSCCFVLELFVSYFNFLASTIILPDQINFHVLGKDMFRVM